MICSVVSWHSYLWMFDWWQPRLISGLCRVAARANWCLRHCTFLFLVMTVSLNVGTCFSHFSAELDPIIMFVYKLLHVFDSIALL